jgi:hypothetical protein
VDERKKRTGNERESAVHMRSKQTPAGLRDDNSLLSPAVCLHQLLRPVVRNESCGFRLITQSHPLTAASCHCIDCRHVILKAKLHRDADQKHADSPAA